MSAKGHNSRHDDNRAGALARPVRPARHEAGSPSGAPRAWVSETIGLDSRMPLAPLKGRADAEYIHYEKVSIVDEGTAAVLAASAATVNPRRFRTPPEPLRDDTMRWLAQMPEKRRPIELARQFPRIANKLAGLRTNSLARSRYLTDLLMDTRDGTREGFPMVVAAELAALLGGVADPTEEEHSSGQIDGTR